MAEVITRKWKDGKLIEETRSEIDWEPNEADLDVVIIGCECGSKFDMPRRRRAMPSQHGRMIIPAR